MILATFAAISLLAQAVPSVDWEWLEKVKDRRDPEAVTWAQGKASELSPSHFREIVAQGSGLCTGCSQSTVVSDDYAVQVLISLSVPVSTWLALSAELSRVNGCFVLRGLPENSWSQLVTSLLELDQLGVTVPILVDPRPFEEWNIQSVPVFVVTEGNKSDRIAGNVSLEWALAEIAERGETQRATELLKLYSEGR